MNKKKNKNAETKDFISNTLKEIINQCKEPHPNYAVSAAKALMQLHALDKDTTLLEDLPKLIIFKEGKPPEKETADVKP